MARGETTRIPHARVARAILRDPELSAQAVRVYMALEMRCVAHPWTTAGCATLGADIGMSVRAVKRAVAQLVRRGVVTSEPRGRGRTSRKRLADTAALEAIYGEDLRRGLGARPDVPGREGTKAAPHQEGTKSARQDGPEMTPERGRNRPVSPPEVGPIVAPKAVKKSTEVETPGVASGSENPCPRADITPGSCSGSTETAGTAATATGTDLSKAVAAIATTVAEYSKRATAALASITRGWNFAKLRKASELKRLMHERCNGTFEQALNCVAHALDAARRPKGTEPGSLLHRLKRAAHPPSDGALARAKARLEPPTPVDPKGTPTERLRVVMETAARAHAARLEAQRTDVKGKQ